MRAQARWLVVFALALACCDSRPLVAVEAAVPDMTAVPDMAAVPDMTAAKNDASIDSCTLCKWTAMESGISVGLRGVWGSGPSDVFAVGEKGTILHYGM